MLKKVLVAINANKEPFIFRSVGTFEILSFCQTNHSFLILLITVSKEEKNQLLIVLRNV